MITLFVAIAVITTLCLSFETTRGLGVLGVVAMIYVYPLSILVLMVLGGVGYYFYKHN